MRNFTSFENAHGIVMANFAERPISPGLSPFRAMSQDASFHYNDKAMFDKDGCPTSLNETFHLRRTDALRGEVFQAQDA